ncbi:hypothetical protein [Paenibacillus spongiae]|uniref:Copper amine oxidase N-terminal domain-containing protein n=1 Tax=Paenibacillus spongiae TaxID=2909671 RepID=A0ABY5S9K6_9BACL|nr:hypothetical protein [Paenibacillus spongiae]UVI29220.1 hypothetical protein L1F29_27925 [Paenibacillus spongiae]
MKMSKLAAALSLSVLMSSVPVALVTAESIPSVLSEKKQSEKTFTVSSAGEALLDLTATAHGVGWDMEDKESAVITLTVDGKYNQDIVLFMGQRKFTYQVSLGYMEPGVHTLSAAFNRDKSPVGATKVHIQKMETTIVSTDSEDALAYRFSPILYGRNLTLQPNFYENNHSDVPLLMYHTLSKNTNGNLTIEYTIICSNEDGGTNTPALMARWGRTTDIEWIYRVTLDSNHNIVSEKYQSPGHGTVDFDGLKEQDHPLMYISTSNNNFTAVKPGTPTTGYRFFLNPSQKLPANRTREYMMDTNPWIYQIMAQEMIREGKLEPLPNPDTKEVSDQRNYLFVEFNKSTSPVNGSVGIGTAIGVKLKGDPMLYVSNHNVPDWSITRDNPAATTVELPAGTTVDAIESIQAMAIPFDNNPNDPVSPPTDYQITIKDVNRAFMLDRDYLPQASLMEWHGTQILTPGQPHAILWTAS